MANRSRSIDSLKTRVKGTVWLLLQWDSSRGSQAGGQWAELKGLLSRNIYSNRESWITALSLTEEGQKGSPPEKNATYKKELLTLTPGNVAEGRSWSRWWWWWVRTSQANDKSMWQSFGVLWAKCQKVYIGNPVPILAGKGLDSHATPVMWYGNGQSTQHLRCVIRLTRRTARNFIFYSRTAVHNILQHYFRSEEDDK